MSAAAAISATVVSSYPLRSNSAAAASISARRVRSRLPPRSHRGGGPTPPPPPARELAGGRSVLAAPTPADGRRWVSSSAGGAESKTGFYFEPGGGPIEKGQTEQPTRGRGVPATVLRPAGFMEDFTSPARF